MAVPFLHRSDTALGKLGPWEPAQRHWRGNDPELDIVARSADGRRLLVGEAKWTKTPPDESAAIPQGDLGRMLGADDAQLCKALFAPLCGKPEAGANIHLVDARTVMRSLT